ncbi:hypothetical protein FACS189444_3180 [Spirochaetia bacterium]|nr:hypothetical protein FACS189444_3180 [Spirochaetia bacterium]
MSYFPKKRKGPRSDRSKAMAKADKAFSEFIRLRDTPGQCPTCGAFISFENSDNCHYIGRANLTTRYDELNCHAGCRKCNRFRSGEIVRYRVWLVERFGEGRIADMERLSLLSGSKMTAFDFELIAQKYKAKAKELVYKRPAKN